MKIFSLVLFLFIATSVCAQPTPTPSTSKEFSAAASEPILPPLIAWKGKSRALLAAKDDPWITPCEKTDFRTTPSYDETIAWLKKLIAAAPQQLRMGTLGKSTDGRDIVMVIATADKQFTPEALRKSGKAIVLAQAGIHAGEIDGKDAGLMLLRDMTVRGTKRALLDHAHFLFVPIFNVDGHERTSRFARINQRGPEMMGWRTTSKNLNLNRDYTKIDSPEMVTMIWALNGWSPDLYLDLHVTDGSDYQYDVTFGWNGPGGHSPAIVEWLEKTFRPAMTNDLGAAGHVPGPTDVPNWIDEMDWSKGIKAWNADPRYSSGYGDVRHLPTVLMETHSLKPYEQRVLGTYIFLESTLRIAGKSVPDLRKAMETDRKRRNNSIPLRLEVDSSARAETIEFKGVETRVVPSAISGGPRLEYTGKPMTASVPYQRQNRIVTSVTRPKAYWVPAAWREVVERLETHAIQFERVLEPRDVKVTMYRLEDVKFESEPFEGHMRLEARPVAEQRTEHYAAGAVRVPTDQPLGNLAIVLLEPASPDSFFQWGFFDQVLQETEYVEQYVIELMAERMLRADSKLAAEFEEKLEKDEAFRISAKQRLHWFYSRTPFRDERWKLYPVGREE